MTRVKVSHLTEDALRAQDEAYLASLPKPKPKPSAASQTPSQPEQPAIPPPPKLTLEEERLKEKWLRVLEIVTKGRVDTMKAFWAREEESLGGVDARVPDWIDSTREGATLLQVAAHAGQEDMTRWLLEDAHANPTLDVLTDQLPTDTPAAGESDDEAAPVISGPRRTAYDIASTKAVRNVFRRCAAAHPDWWDWLGAARVPSILTKEMEEGRDEKKKVRRKGLKDKIKEREAREKTKEVEVEVARTPSPPPVARPAANGGPTMGPRKLGGASGSAEGVAGLTPEMRAKIERERRARAAESRMQALSGKQ